MTEMQSVPRVGSAAPREDSQALDRYLEEIAALPLSVKGFGAVKLAAAQHCETRERELLERFLKREHACQELGFDEEEEGPHADR